jgi:predicted Zn-dependent protease
VTPVEPDFLTLFTECLERNDLRGAARHLEAYVQRHPDQPLFRFQLATLYARSHCPDEARFHYECFARDAESQGQALQSQVITAHIQLLEMAQQRGDRFAELYHRGVGLWLLVRQQDSDPNRDAAFCEEILCKAYRALTEAKELKPNDPRIRTYLAAVQEAMGNRLAAAAERAALRGNPVCGEHTGWERKLD